MINLGDSKQSTPTISKNLNPEWNVTFDLPVDGVHCGVLEAVCWDWDRFGKDFLGEFDVVVEDIFANGQTVQEVRCFLRPMEHLLILSSLIGTHWSRDGKDRRRRELYQERFNCNLR